MLTVENVIAPTLPPTLLNIGKNAVPTTLPMRLRIGKNADARNVTYYAAHQEEQRAYCVAYFAAHREEQRARDAAWREAHPEELRARHHRRRVRKLGNGGTHTAADIRLQIKAQTDKKGHLRCWWCGEVIKGNSYHVDHRIPLAKGGGNGAENIVLAHPTCNHSKGAKTPAEFMGRLL